MVSDFSYVDGIDALAAFLGFELNPVVLLNLPSVQAGDMHEKIFLRGIIRNEAVSLGLIKEFYGPCFHWIVT